MERRHGAVCKFARVEAALGALLGVGERLDGKVREPGQVGPSPASFRRGAHGPLEDAQTEKRGRVVVEKDRHFQG